MKRLAPLLLVIVAACATSTPDQSFKAMESRLLVMDPLEVSFALKSTGAVTSTSNGTLKATGRDVIVNAETTVDGATTKRSHALTDHDAKTSQKELLVLAWARMGLLHNMVMLASGKPIVHDVEQNVRVENVRWNRANHSFLFDLVVEGQRVGEAVLWLDRGGRPVRRDLTVHFPNGDMQVEEQYTWP